MPENQPKSSTVAKNKYNAKAYDSLRIVVPKGDKERIKNHAAKKDKGSINGFVKRAIDETIERDTATMTKED